MFEPVHGSAPDIFGKGNRESDRDDPVRRDDAGISQRETGSGFDCARDTRCDCRGQGADT